MIGGWVGEWLYGLTDNWVVMVWEEEGILRRYYSFSLSDWVNIDGVKKYGRVDLDLEWIVEEGY